ncbi:MAG: ATP-binding cassette domain-containing protein [Desulfobacteraceae bacterium]|nr:ATP-binding cassette domain-containing protein [Desulfobacteraceae bacterium]
MKELVKRLKSLPLLSSELVLASLFISILGLSSPIFVIQVLRRYVTSGIDSTLITLVTGVLVAIAMEFAFRQVRLRLARGLNLRPDAELSAKVFSTLTDARTGAIESVPPVQRREITGHLNTVLQAYNPVNFVSILDIPFAFLYVIAIFFLKPMLAIIVILFLTIAFVFSIINHLLQKEPQKNMQQAIAKNNSLANTVLQASDSVRSFNAAKFLKEIWGKQQGLSNILKRRMVILQGLSQSITASLQALMNVAVIAVGAVYAVQGEMSVAALIGANILASRALAPIIRFAQLGPIFINARQSLDLLENFCKIPREMKQGTALKNFAGKIELSDVAFRFGRASTPLFESASLVLNPGGLLVVTGSNGTGKTTLARLFMGLLVPVRGNLFVDGIDLRQILPYWWRQQIIYMPQEPVFFDGTIKENLLTNNSDIEEDALAHILEKAGLRKFLDEGQAGLETLLINGGKNLALGIRRRIALARALITDGQLVIIDEPAEGLDLDGVTLMFKMITEFAQSRKTMILFSHNPNILKGHGSRLDLNVKPVPKLTFAQNMTVPTERLSEEGLH